MSHSSMIRRCILGLACAAALANQPAVSATRGATTPDGFAFFEGGIGSAEVEALQAERTKYSLWVVTAVRASGAYVADVRVRITGAGGHVVFDRRLEGPWLLIDLPAGRYEVQASFEQEVLHRATTVRSGRHHHLVFYFDVEGDVLSSPPP